MGARSKVRVEELHDMVLFDMSCSSSVQKAQVAFEPGLQLYHTFAMWIGSRMR